MIITIKGKPGEGKSVLAVAISRFLKEQGFGEVAVKDEDLATGSYNYEFHDKKMDAIKARPILIQTEPQRVKED